MNRAAFDAFALPRRVSGMVGAFDADPVGHDGGPAPFVRYLNMDPERIGLLLDALVDARPALLARSAAAVAGTLGTVGARFGDPGDAFRREALELLPATSGLSAPMAEAVLDGMAADWTVERLQSLVNAELGDARLLDAFGRGKAGSADPARKVMAVGPRLCFQILAGSVPGVSVQALLRSLLVKSPTLLKPGRGDVVLPVLFARALREADPELADALAVVYWPGGHKDTEDAALAGADLVTAYGSDETVGELRARTPPATRFVGYHHRVSVGIVGREALAGSGLDGTAAEVAEAVALFDRRGCVSPQVVFVEASSDPSSLDADGKRFATAVANHLRRLEASLPSGELGRTEAARLHQLRGTAELMASDGTVAVVHGGKAPWTVIVETTEGPTIGSCAGRTLTVRPVRDLGLVPGLLAPLARHLQTVGVAGLGSRTEEIARGLGAVGASRIVPFRAVPFPPPWWHHDGRGPLLDLVRWVDLESE